jgi:hypothetical protein
MHSYNVALGCPLQHTLSKSSCFYLYSYHPEQTTSSLHCVTHSLALLRSTCPSHLSLQRLTRSTATSTIPKRPNKSWDLCLCFSVTPHIHLTIILSVLSNCCISLTSEPTFRYHTPSHLAHTPRIYFLSPSKIPLLHVNSK